MRRIHFKTLALLGCSLLAGCLDFTAPLDIVAEPPPTLAPSAVLVSQGQEGSRLRAVVGRLRSIGTLQAFDFNYGRVLGVDSTTFIFPVNIINGPDNPVLYDFAPNAKVTLFEEGGVGVAAAQAQFLLGRFEAQGMPTQAGRQYRVLVEAPGYPACEATEQAPVEVPLSSVAFTRGNIRPLASDDDRVGSTLSLWFETPPQKGHYYRAEVYILISDSDSTVRRAPIGAFRISSSVSGADFTDDSSLPVGLARWDIGVSNDDVPPGTRLLISFSSVSEGFFRWKTVMQTIADVEGTPFTELPSAYSNWTCGAGLFYIAAAPSERELVVP